MNECELVKEEMSYERIKKQIVFRLTGGRDYVKNFDSLLRDPAGNGLFKIYVIELSQQFSVLLTKKLVEKMGYSIENIYRDAELNTESLYPPVFKNIEKAIMESITGTGVKENLLTDKSPEEYTEDYKSQMYVLTNDSARYGASVICYKGVVEKVSEIMKGDFYMIPSSVHEFIILSADVNKDSRSLNNILTDVNSCYVKDGEILGNQVLYYSEKSCKIELSVKVG